MRSPSGSIALAALLSAISGAQAARTLSFCIDAAPEGFDMVQFKTTGTFDDVGVPIY